MPDLDITQYTVRPELGRHMVLDERSLAYRRRYTGEPIKPVEWTPKAPVLNQQDLLTQGIHTSQLFQGVEDVDALGSCTANSATCLISILRTADDLNAAGLDVTDPVAAERWAIGLYSDATHRDQWHEQAWPASDCGSSGLGVAKALRHRGLIDQYGHATTALELCRDLQNGPVLMGMPWADHFFTPDQDGFIDSGDWTASPIAGGHEVAVVALESVSLSETGRLEPNGTVLRFVNSWSSSWADHGYGRFRLSTYIMLRDQIDIVQPRLDANR